MRIFYLRVVASIVCVLVFLFPIHRLSAQNVPNGATQPAGSYTHALGIPLNPSVAEPNSEIQLIPQVPYAMAGEVHLSTPAQNVKVGFSYQDGFNRTFQTLDRYASRSDNVLKDRVTVSDNRPKLYGQQLLPYGITHSGNYRTYGFSEQYIYHLSKFPGEGYTPYAFQSYESNSDSRSSTTYLPGKSQVGQQRGTKTTGRTNLAGNPIRIWKTNGIVPVSPGSYPVGELFISEVERPDQGKAISYTDKSGRMVLSQKLDSILVMIGSNIYFYQSTYYVYDDLGNLRFILPPKAVAAIESNNWVVTTAVLNGLCFQYQYDSKGRLSAERKPGEGDFTRFVYDRKQRIVMRQTPKEKAANQWEVTFYDRQSRVIATSLFVNTATQANWQSLFDTYSGASYPTNNIRYYLATDAGEGIYPPETGISGNTMMSYTWYDHYGLIDPNNQLYTTCISQLNFTEILTASEAIGAEAPTRSLRTHGLVTGSKVRILPAPEADPAKTGQWRQSYNWYDDKGRLTFSMRRDLYQSQIIHAHYTGNQYDFSNRLLLTKHKMSNSNSAYGSAAHTELTRNSYEDITGNLVQIAHKVNTGAWQILAKYEYDDLGRVKRETLGNNGEIRDYDYNIRGQLTGINAEYAETGTAPSINSRTFGESLKYDYGMSHPRYDGKISGMLWRGSGGTSGTLTAYGYVYDRTGRMSRADYRRYSLSGGGYTWNNLMDDRSVKDLYYDKNGNILSMVQRGPAPPFTVQPVNIDQLSYDYLPNTNQLSSVTDAVSTNYGFGDFQNGLHTGADYAYDANGNLTQDLNKGITSVTYTHFNKPETVTFNTNNKRISYSYDAAGNKVQELIRIGSTTTRTDYIGNFVYRNDSLRYALTGQGRTVWQPNNTTKEEFFVKDHLGNVRSVIDIITYPIIELMATYEVASANLETMVFDKVDEIRVEKPGSGGPEDHMAGRLNATEKDYRVGTSLLMKVMAGDRVEMQVDNYYASYKADLDHALPAESVLESLLTTLTGGKGGFEGSESHDIKLVDKLFNPDNFGQLMDLVREEVDEAKPKAFLNYTLFNEDMEVVKAFTGRFQVDGEGAWSTIGTSEPMAIPQNGYLAVYVSTQTQIECGGCEASASDVYFDYFTLQFTRGNLKEETHYYPFGLPMASSAAADFMPSRYRYQSNEYRKEAGLNWMDFHARQYDPQIGRFLSVDPLADAGGQQVFSPYAAMGNDPANMVDPGGMIYSGFRNINAYVPLNLNPGFAASSLQWIFGDWKKHNFFFVDWGKENKNNNDDRSDDKGGKSDGNRGKGKSGGADAKSGQSLSMNTMYYLAYLNKGTKVNFNDGEYEGRGIMLPAVEVSSASGITDWAGWGERMDARFGTSLGYDFSGYGKSGLSNFEKASLIGSTISVVPSTIEMGAGLIKQGANYTDDIAKVAKISSRTGRLLGWGGVGLTIADGATNGWQNHHTADLIIGGVQTLFLGTGPVGWGVGLVWLTADLITIGVTDKSITENLFD